MALSPFLFSPDQKIYIGENTNNYIRKVKKMAKPDKKEMILESVMDDYYLELRDEYEEQEE